MNVDDRLKTGNCSHEIIVGVPKEDQLPELNVIEADEFLKLELPPRENILEPWLPTQGLAMIYAARGTGKTLVSLNIAYAVASGGSFLGWQAPKPRGVLFIDGEMPGNVLQERLAHIVSAADKPLVKPLRIVTPDLQEFNVPDLSDIDGQAAINTVIDDDIDLVVVDNLSTLVRTGKENEGESWQPIQTWALGLRKQGKSVLFIHHTNKGGHQRGSSRREDVLDTSIELKRPSEYNPIDSAVFEIHFQKSRGICGEDVEPFEARLATDDHGRQIWITKTVAETTFNKVTDLLNAGLSQKDISIELAINKSNVSRHAKKAKELGLVVIDGDKKW